jgi:dihydroneopterin aldolase
MAERAAEIVLNEFDIKWLRLRIGKPGALDDADDVSVVIEREKKL